MKASKKSTEGDCSRLLGAMLFGCLAGILSLAALWLILSAVALADADPMRLLDAFSLAALLVGALASGFVGGMRERGSPSLAGVCSGALYVLVLWLISLFFRGRAEDTIAPLWLALGYGACLLASLLGGFAARPRRIGSSAPAAAARRRIKARR